MGARAWLVYFARSLLGSFYFQLMEPVCRLLDDNRELFVPELQEVIKPHPHFMLFATQNPAGKLHAYTDHQYP